MAAGELVVGEDVAAVALDVGETGRGWVGEGEEEGDEGGGLHCGGGSGGISWMEGRERS